LKRFVQEQGIHPVGLIYFSEEDVKCIEELSKRCLGRAPKPRSGRGSAVGVDNSKYRSVFEKERSDRAYAGTSISNAYDNEYWSWVRLVGHYQEISKEDRLQGEAREAMRIIKG